MLNLYGQLGVLYQNGKQVAGVFDWEIHVILEYTVKNGYKDYRPIKKLSAASYWLTEPIKDNEFLAKFYQVNNEKLVLMDESIVRIDFPDTTTLDKRLDTKVKIEWMRLTN